MNKRVTDTGADPEVGALLTQIAPTLRDILEGRAFAVFVFDAEDTAAQVTFITNADEETVKDVLLEWARIKDVPETKQ